MPAPTTVRDLLDQVRAQLDEANTEDVSDSDILACLNRGQRKATNILSRRYPDMLVGSPTEVTTTATDVYDLPEGAFGRRLQHVVLVRDSSLEYKLDRVTYRDLYRYTTTTSTVSPRVYAILGKKYYIRPTPTAGLTLKLYYASAPETLVLPQGRLTDVSVANTRVTVDSLGDDLGVDVDDLSAFVNIVDAQTGTIKATLQAQTLASSAPWTVAFKTSSLDRSSVYNRTVATAIPTTVAEDDYLCAVQGTCVPDLPDSCLDFMIQFAVNEVRRRMGEAVQDEVAMLKSFEDDIERQWSGRELSSRVQNKSPAWKR